MVIVQIETRQAVTNIEEIPVEDRRCLCRTIGSVSFDGYIKSFPNWKRRFWTR